MAPSLLWGTRAKGSEQNTHQTKGQAGAMPMPNHLLVPATNKHPLSAR